MISFDYLSISSKKSLGGGAILDLGIYAIQMAQWVFTEKPDSIIAEGTLNEEGVDLQVSATLKYKTGGIANLKISAKDQYDNVAVIKGTKGTIEVRMHTFFKEIFPIILKFIDSPFLASNFTQRH